MKTILRSLFLICLLGLANHVSAQYSDLRVLDPQQWGSDNATIEEASLTIKPKGVYMEYGLYLTISAKDSRFDGNANPPLEIVMNFCLPENSIIHDSWLWVGNDIMQAILIDRNVATQIYEGIVDRRKDPSLLTKNSDGCYELRVYPLAGNSTRKLKITYLVPARWTRNLVSAALPVDLLRLSNTVPDLDISIYTDATFQNPTVNELGFLPFINYAGSGVYTSKISTALIDDYSSMEFSFASPLQNGLFSCDYPVGNSEGYYQLVFHPQQALQITTPKKVALLLEYSSGSNQLQKHELFAKTREMVQEYFQPTDSFNVLFVSNGSVKRMSNDWLPANQVSIQSAFSVVPNSWQAGGNTTMLVADAINFIRTHGNDGEALLISNANNYINTTSANQMINGLVAGATPNIAIHVLNYAGESGYYYYDNYSSYMNYVYENLTAQTGGNYVKHQYESSCEYWGWDYYYYYSRITTSFTDLMHAMFASFDAAPHNYSLHIEPDNGFCYSEIELSSRNITSGQPLVFVGKYFGDSPLKVEYQGMQNGNLVVHTAQGQSYAGDSLTRKIWAGTYISELEKGAQTNSQRKEIVDTSMANRVLSLYTAFLALEPNDTLAACENCEDDSGNNGNVSTPVVSVDSSTVELLASPNPFSASVTISISVDAKDIADAELIIYNMMGQEVFAFRDLNAAASQNNITLVWNGEDASGNTLPNGVYMAVLVTANGKQVVKLVKAG